MRQEILTMELIKDIGLKNNKEIESMLNKTYSSIIMTNNRNEIKYPNTDIEEFSHRYIKICESPMFKLLDNSLNLVLRRNYLYSTKNYFSNNRNPDNDVLRVFQRAMLRRRDPRFASYIVLNKGLIIDDKYLNDNFETLLKIDKPDDPILYFAFTSTLLKYTLFDTRVQSDSKLDDLTNIQFLILDKLNPLFKKYALKDKPIEFRSSVKFTDDDLDLDETGDLINSVYESLINTFGAYETNIDSELITNYFIDYSIESDLFGLKPLLSNSLKLNTNTLIKDSLFNSPYEIVLQDALSGNFSCRVTEELVESIIRNETDSLYNLLFNDLCNKDESKFKEAIELITTDLEKLRFVGTNIYIYLVLNWCYEVSNSYARSKLYPNVDNSLMEVCDIINKELILGYFKGGI